MKQWPGFEHGMGIGGWLTNYKRLQSLPEERRMQLTVGDFEHFASYITRDDIRYIRSLGMDHVRLGFDQIVLESEPYVYRPEIMGYLRRFVEDCKAEGLQVVLNLHKAVGNYCDLPGGVSLLENEELQNRFVALWLALEHTFSDEGAVAFELLNEVLDVEPQLWNDLAEKTVRALRRVNPTRPIVIGSTCWSSPDRLKDLRLYDDEQIVYTFHTYAPFEFTHQRGVLQPDCCYYNRNMPYPGEIERYRDYRRTVRGEEKPYAGFERMDIAYIRSSLQPAAAFAAAHPDKTLWCGEFGTIRHCELRSRENWMRDVITVLKEHEIPYCVWNYLSTPYDGNRFSLVDDDSRRIVSSRMAEIIRGDL